MQSKETPTLISVINQASREISGGKNNPTNTGNIGQYASIRLVKEAQGSQMFNNIATPPGFYSPFLTTSSFQIPNNRNEVYLWTTFWYENDPKVAAAINFYTDFIFSGFKLNCQSSYVKDYFDKKVKSLNFSHWLPLVSFTYHLYGDCFAFVELDCIHCQGSNIDQDTGETCQHEGATWKSISLLDPSYVKIAPGMATQKAVLFFQPDDQLVRIAETGQPKEQFDQIPKFLVQQILSKQPIYLDPACVYHFKRAAAPWSPYGTSLIRPLFPILALKDKYRQAQYTIADRMVLPVRVVKVGTPERPANEQDLNNVQEQLAARALDPLMTIVTHHGFEMEWIGASAGIFQLSGEHENIENDLLDGVMLSKSFFSGEGPQYGGNMGLLALDRRLERFRLEVAQWMEESIFKPEAIRNGFTIQNSDGEEEIVYPTVVWNDLQLRDETSRLQTLQALRSSGDLSAETMLEALGLDYDQEVERLRFEQSSSFAQVGGAVGGGGLGGGFTGGLGGGGLGGLGGGIEGEAGPEGGVAPGSTEAPAPGGEAAPAPGAPPPPAMARSKKDNYRLASTLSYHLSQMAPKENEPKYFKSAAHKNFYRDRQPVTGLSFRGALPKTFSTFLDGFTAPDDGGPLVTALNQAAVKTILAYETKHPRIVVAKNKKKEEEEQPQVRLFTKLEQELYKIIQAVNIPLPLYAQLVAGPSREYTLDAAFPAIGLGIEADSETFHSNPQQIEKDKHRDAVLGSQGWYILRFTDREIKNKPEEIAQVITQVASQLMASAGQIM